MLLLALTGCCCVPLATQQVSASGLRATGLCATGLRASGLRADPATPGEGATGRCATGLRATGLRATGFCAIGERTLPEGRGAVPTVVTGDGADAASGFGSDGEADVVSDGEDEAGEVYFTRRSIVPRVADERHWTTPSRRAPNALQIARASLQCPGTPRPGSTPPPAALTPMVLPPPATQSSSDQQWGGATTSLSAGLVSATWFICGAAIGHEWPGRFVYILGLWHFNRPWLLPLRHPQCWRPVTMVVVGVQFIRRRQVGAPFDRRDRRLTIEGRR